MTSQLSGTHPFAQTGLVLHHPMFLLRAIAHSLGLAAIIAFYAQTIGVFGWLNVALRPGVVYLLPLANFVLVWRGGFGGVVEPSKKRALWWIVLPLTCAVVIMVAAYLMWAQVGQDNVTGLQGRYLIPLLCLAGLAVIELTSASRPPARRWHVLAGTAALIVMEIVAMDATIVRAFHVF